MTIGSQISDQRTYVEAYGFVPGGSNRSFGYQRVGDYFSRNWTGGDQTQFGPLQEHSYVVTRVSSSNPICRWTFHGTNGQVVDTHMKAISSSSITLPSVSSSWNSNDELKVINKLKNRVSNTDFNLGNFVAEGHQTMNLLSENARRIASMLHHIRNGNLYKAANSVGVRISSGHVLTANKYKSPAHYSRAVSNAILELDFGWRPLVSDVDEAARGMAYRMNVPYKQMNKARRVVKDSESYTVGNYKVYSTCDSKMELRFYFEAPPSFASVFSLNAPLSALWEVTPWSFVVDWALPVSDYLSALHFQREFNITQAWKTLTVIKKSVVTGGIGSVSLDMDNGSPFTKITTVNRSPFSFSSVSDIPLPTLKSLDKIATFKHMTDGIALLTQAANGFTKSIKF